jgi:hypothetical protein
LISLSADADEKAGTSRTFEDFAFAEEFSRNDKLFAAYFLATLVSQHKT